MRDSSSPRLAGALLASSLLVFAALGVAAQDGPAAGAERGVEQLEGSWRYSGSAEHGTRIIHRAVDRTVAPMNFFVREIAAGRLRGKNQLVRRIQIAVDGQSVRVVFDGSRTYETRLSQWRQHRFDGDSINVQFRYRNGALVQLFRSDSGTRRNIYRMQGDGRLQLDVTVQSDQLPRDMRYRLLYRQ